MVLSTKNEMEAIRFKKCLSNELKLEVKEDDQQFFCCSIVAIVVKAIIKCQLVEEVSGNIHTLTKTIDGWSLIHYLDRTGEIIHYIELTSFGIVIGRSENCSDWILGDGEKINYVIK